MDAPEAATFALLAHELHERDGFEETVDLLVQSAPALVGAQSASVLVLTRGRLVASGFGTDEIADKVDLGQIDSGDGPAYEAIAQLRSIVVRDTATDPRWPAWTQIASSVGVRSAISVRLWTTTCTLGAVNLYAAEPDAFDADALGIAEILGRHASVALAAARQEESLSQAIDARKLVGQAQGILMERYDLDDRQAFDVLRRYSQTTNTKLNEVARMLIDTRRLPQL